MVHQITTEKVLEAAKNCTQAKQTLEILFPEAFEETKPFCKVGDVLIRKNIRSFYQVIEVGYQLALINLSTGKQWETRIPQPYISCCPTEHKIITKANMRRLLEGQVKNLSDIKVLDIDSLQKDFF